MENLKIGFARLNINPMLGVSISGYFIERRAEGFLDDIEVNHKHLYVRGAYTRYS